MNKDLIKKIEADWSSYFEKCQSQNGIAWEGEGVMAKMIIYQGDLPESGAYKPDMMPSIVDNVRRFYTTHDEHFAARMMFSVPEHLRLFVMVPPLKVVSGLKQEAKAHLLGCSLDQYKRKRAKAKLVLTLKVLDAVEQNEYQLVG